MEYKVLIKLYVPEIENTYEMYIPINRTVGEVVRLMNQIVHNMSEVFPIRENIHLYNRYTNSIYPRNQLIRDTDIRNGTELVMTT